MVKKGLYQDNLVLRGFSLSYLGILVFLPIIAMVAGVFKENLKDVWHHVTRPDALYALGLTIKMALFILIINVITGVATAWVLARYNFRFKRLMNALIDLPFAIPTVVTGIMLVTFYGPRSVIGVLTSSLGIEIIYNHPGILLALLYVTFPFVVRSVQPVILEMEKDMEEAAQTLGATPFYIFRRITLPTLIPAILTGAALSFSRALGEFGSIVVVAGNIPYKTQVAAVYVYGEVESGNIPGALTVSFVLLAISFIIILCLNLIQKWSRKR